MLNAEVNILKGGQGLREAWEIADPGRAAHTAHNHWRDRAREHYFCSSKHALGPSHVEARAVFPNVRKTQPRARIAVFDDLDSSTPRKRTSKRQRHDGDHLQRCGLSHGRRRRRGYHIE